MINGNTPGVFSTAHHMLYALTVVELQSYPTTPSIFGQKLLSSHSIVGC